MKGVVVPLLLAETGFFIAVGYVISTRLDEAAVTLLSGVLIGTLIGAPIAGLATYTVLRFQVEPHLADRHMAIVPNALAAVPLISQPKQLTQQSDAFVMPPTRRRFYLIGEDGAASELLPDGTHCHFAPKSPRRLQPESPPICSQSHRVKSDSIK